MRAAQYELLATMVAEAVRVGTRSAELDDRQAETVTRDAVAHFAWLMQNSDDTFGGRWFNPYVFAAAAGYPLEYPCGGTVDEVTQRAANRYAAGASLAQVAHELGEPVASVRARLAGAGVQIRKR